MPPKYATDIDAVLDAIISSDADVTPESGAARDIQDVLGLLRTEGREAAREPKPAPRYKSDLDRLLDLSFQTEEQVEESVDETAYLNHLLDLSFREPTPAPAPGPIAVPTPAPPAVLPPAPVAPPATRAIPALESAIAAPPRGRPPTPQPAPASAIAKAGVPIGPQARSPNVGQVYRDAYAREQTQPAWLRGMLMAQGGALPPPELVEGVGGPMTAGAVGPLAGALQFMAANLDSPSLQQISNVLNQMAVDTMPEHPNFGQEVLAAGTSTAIFWAIGLGTMGGVGQIQRISPLLAKLTGGSAMVVAEAMGEAGPVAQEAYGKAIQKGLTPDQAMYEATAAANRAFVGNSLWLAATQKLGGPLEAPGKTMLRTIGKRATAEGVQEGGQEAIDALAQGEAPELGRVAKSAGIGALVGGGFGGAEGAARGLPAVRVPRAIEAPRVEPTEAGGTAEIDRLLALSLKQEPTDTGESAPPAVAKPEPTGLEAPEDQAQTARQGPTGLGDVEAVLTELQKEPAVTTEEAAPGVEPPRPAAPEKSAVAPGSTPEAPAGSGAVQQIERLPAGKPATQAAPLWSTAPHAGRVIDALPDGTYQVRNVETGQVEEGGIPSVSQATIVRDAITSSLPRAEEEPAPAAPPTSRLRPPASGVQSTAPAGMPWRVGLPPLPSPAAGLTPEAAQARIDAYEDELIAMYGERAVFDAPTYPEQYRQMSLPVPTTPLTEAQVSRLRTLYDERDAINAAADTEKRQQVARQIGPVPGLSAEQVDRILQQVVTEGEYFRARWGEGRDAAEDMALGLNVLSEAVHAELYPGRTHEIVRPRFGYRGAQVVLANDPIREEAPDQRTLAITARFARGLGTTIAVPGLPEATSPLTPEAPESVPPAVTARPRPPGAPAADAPEDTEPDSLPRNVGEAFEAARTDKAVRARAKREAAQQGPQAMLGGLAAGQTRPQADPASARRELARTLHAIVQTMNEHGSQPFRSGRFRGAPTVLAKFFPKTKMIQSAVAEDVENITHELGHYLQLHVFGSLSGNVGFLRRHRAELIPIATKGTRGKPDAREGFAEFIRLYLTDPQEARAKAPQTYDDLEQVLEAAEPGLLADMQAFQRRYTGWTQMPVLERARQMIVYPEGFLKTPRVSDMKAALHRAYAYVKDDRHTINRLAAEIEQLRGPQSADVDLRILGSVIRGASGIGRAFLTEGAVDFATRRPMPGSKPLAEIIEPVWHELEWFDAYSLLRRAQSLLGKPDERLQGAARNMLEAMGLDADTLDAVIAATEGERPAYRDAFEQMQQWRVSLLDYIRDSGALTHEAYDWFVTMHDNYVPWERVYDDSEMTWQQADFAGARPRGASVANVPSPFKTLRGRTFRPIASPTLGMVKQASVITSAAERAHIGQVIADWLDPDMPDHLPEPTRWGRKLPMPLRPVELSLAEIVKTLEAAGFDTSTVPPAALDEIATVFRPTTAKALAGRENTLLITRHGKREVWEVDPDLHWAMLALGRGPVSRIFQNVVGAMVRVPTMFMRANFTLSPDFMVRAPLRDQMEIFLRTGQVPFAGFFRNLATALFKPSTYARYVQELDRLGANYTIRTFEGRSHFFTKAVASTLETLKFHEASTKMARRSNPAWVNLRDAMERRKHMDLSAAERAKLYAKMALFHPLQVMNVILDLTETPTRLGSMQRRLAHPLPQDQTERARQLRAGYEARRFPIEYDRTGPVLQTLGPVTAFMSASVEGTDAFLRDAAKHPLRFLVSLAVGALFSLVARLYNDRNDQARETYSRLDANERNTHWVLVPDEGRPIKMVKPYGMIGFINLFERGLLEWAYEHDPKALDGLADAIVHPYAPPVLPDMMRLGLEQWGNWMFFQERPVVTEAMEQRDAGYQYDEFTPAPFIWLGQHYGISPKRLEHIFRGGVVRDVSDLTGMLRRQIWDAPQPPDSGLADFPGIRAFVSRYPTFSAQPVQDFWRSYNEIQQHKNSLSFIRKHDPEREENYVEQHPGVTRWASQAERVADRLRRNRQRRLEVWKDPTMTGEEKQLALDALAVDSIERTEGFLRRRSQFEAELNTGDMR